MRTIEIIHDHLTIHPSWAGSWLATLLPTC